MTVVAEGIRTKQPFVMLNLFQHNAPSLVIPERSHREVKQVRDDDFVGNITNV